MVALANAAGAKDSDFFTRSLAASDPDVARAISNEL